MRRDLRCRPADIAKVADNLANERGLSHVLRLPTDHDQRHEQLLRSSTAETRERGEFL